MSDAAVADNDQVPANKGVPVGRVLFVLIAFGIAVSAIWLLHTGRNYQETFSLGIAQTNSSNVLVQASPDDPMPLYLLLVHGLAHWFTPGLLVLRALSLVFYILMLPLAYAAGRAATDDKRVGLLAAVLMGLSPFMLWYGNRATMYALLALVTLLNQFFFTGILTKKGRWYWVGYVLSGLIGIGIHYFFGVVLVLQLLFFVFHRRNFVRRDMVKMLVAGIAFALVFVVLARLIALHSQAWGSLPYTSKPSATNAFIILVQFLFGFQSVVTTTFVIAFWPLLVVLALLAVQKYVRPPIAVQYALFAAFGPIIGIFVLSWLWRPLFLSSYFIICLPPFMLLLSWYLVAFELKALAWARGILVLVMLAMLFVEVINPGIAIREDYLGDAAPASSTGHVSLEQGGHP